MKFKKQIIICALLVLVILCVMGASSAEESLNENLTITDDGGEVIGDVADEPMMSSDSDDKLSAEKTVNNYDELNTAITNAADGDTIILNDGTYEFQSGFTLDKSLTFKGQSKGGVTITSSGNYAIFQVLNQNCNLKIQNLNFDGVSNIGSGIVYMNSNGNLDIIDCTFKDCSAGWSIIRAHTGFTGIATLNNVNFFNCQQNQGKETGVILSFLGASTINVNKVVIEGSKYTLTSAKSKGVIYISNAASTSTFDDLTIKGSTGIKTALINLAGTSTIRNSKIIDNTIDSIKVINNAGTLTIEQTIIVNNTANSGSNLFFNQGSSSAVASLTLNYNNIAENTVANIYGQNNYDNTKYANYNYWGANYDNQADLKTATNIDQSTWANKIGDDFVDQEGNALAQTIPTLSDVPQAGDVYVSANGDDAKDGSTPDNAVGSLKHAIELANEANGIIIILPGDYTVNELLNISKDLTIKCESGLATIKGTAAQIFNNTASLSLENIKFTSSSANNGAIINNTAGTLNIDKCTFEVDGADASAIYVDGGNINIQNSVLLNPTGYALTVSSTPTTVTANNNWWGKNDAAKTNANVDSWIVMDASIDSERISPNDKITITASFNKNNNGEDFTGKLPEFNVTFTAANLNEEITIRDNAASVEYTVTADDEVTVTSASESIKIPLNVYIAPDVVYVDDENGNDDFDGDQAHPFKTIAQAIKLSQKGKIVIVAGTYTIDSTLIVDKDLDIIGQGTVIIDGSSKSILNNKANLNITNIKFTNAGNNQYVVLNNGNMTISQSEFYLNKLKGSGNTVVRNAANSKLTIDNSKFHDNVAGYGNVNNYGILIINNTEFYDNDMSEVTVPYGFILYNSGGNALIENINVTNNKGYKGAFYIKDAGLVSISNATFDSNTGLDVGSGAICAENSNIVISDSRFINNIAKQGVSETTGRGGAIYFFGGNVNVTTSVFMNNNADNEGKDIYVYSGELNITDSVLINTNGYSLEKASSAVVTANDNWWGANTPNTPVDVERNVVMTVTVSDENIEIGDEITITASFDKTNNGEAYTGDLPEVFTVTFTSDSGNLNEEKTVKAKKAEVTYTVVDADKRIIVSSSKASETLKVNKTLEVIYVSESGSDNNYGDRDDPVATLSQAIKLAQNGQIVILPGTIKTGYLGIISNDLTITGEGKVVIDAENNNRILYVGNDSKVVLKNLILIRGMVSESLDESGALLGNNGDLTLINCTLANSTSAKNGGAIFNARNLTIINSTFENNHAEKNGGAIFTQSSGAGIPFLNVSNSIFKGNSAKGSSNYGGGAIYAQGADYVLITDSLFEENSCTDYGGGAVEITLTERATIDNTTFIKNTATGEAYPQKADYGGGAISFIGQYSDLKETLTVTNSLFIENSVTQNGGGAIYARYSKVNVVNSVLINNNDVDSVSLYRRTTDMNTAQITANDNWWGSNDSPKSEINGGTLSRWAILTVTNASEVKAGETVKLTVSINQYTIGSENGSLANPIKIERPVTIHTNFADIEGTLVNGEFTTDYLVPENLKIISATVDSETQILLVITTQTTVEIENITGMMGDRLEYTIKVTAADGSVINTGNVELYFGDELIKTIPVLNGEAKDTIIINKKTGDYPIVAKYIDTTQEFASTDATKTLNVTGIDNIVTPETLSKFFDGDVMKSDLPFDELIFQGTFNNIGVLTIGKTIKLIGEDAKFVDSTFALKADGIELTNTDITLNDAFEEIDSAAVYIGGNNVIVSNNNITYNAPSNVQSYGIEVDVAHDVKIINNKIKYAAKSEGGVKTIAINVLDSENFVFENNELDATISSIAISYAYPYTYFSEGMYVSNSKNASINKNNITVNYDGIGIGDDTIYAVHVTGSDDAKITENNIELNGHKYAYALVIDGKNFNITKNNIKSTSDDKYSAGLTVNMDSTGSIEENNISATANEITYAVCADDWAMGSELSFVNNNISAQSNTAYGLTVTAKTAEISGNDIVANGNFTIALGVKNADSTVSNNKIVSNGTNIGESLDMYPIFKPIETLGVYAEKANVKIEGNDISSTGSKSIALTNSSGSIKNNELVANGVKGDSTISSQNSKVDLGKTTPAKAPVVKITAKNNAKVDYGFTYKVRITQDGKSVGAGKQVTLKIAGKTLKAKTDKNGYATFTLSVKPKAYTATVTYNKVTQKYKITVKNVIAAKNLKVKKSAKKLKVKVTLKTSAKSPIKNKKVTLKIKGKKIKATTNKKGVATFIIKKSILKKLKAGKKYKYQIVYGADTIQKTLKVKK